MAEMKTFTITMRAQGGDATDQFIVEAEDIEDAVSSAYWLKFDADVMAVEIHEEGYRPTCAQEATHSDGTPELHSATGKTGAALGDAPTN